LKLVEYCTSSYLDKKLKPLERIYKIWFVNFALRLWRFWILCDDTYNLQQHFVTPNISECVEVNAHSLLLTIINLKKEKLPQLLMPWKFSSQSCEGLFRLLRSASSTSSTQTNFSVRNFLYPRNRKTFDEDIAAHHPIHELPSEEEMEITVLQAQKDAEAELALLG
jgi:hypothetical protein